ncbi:MAG TPA: TIGR02996 domain-containing protein [Gemmataceae bacterium]
MSDREAFLRTICENPADDAPRLVFADWLEEHGEAERAEFIRLQVEKARLPADDPRHALLHTRDLELRGRFGEAWRRELPRIPGVSWHHRFWRGFVSGADVAGWRFFRRHADALFAATPVQFLHFTRLMQDQCPELVASPYLGRLLGLNLSGTFIGDEGVRTLAECPGLAGLQTLELRGNLTQPWGVAVPRDFRYPMFTGQGGWALVRSRWLKDLEQLDVRFNLLTRAVVQALRERFGDRVLVSE